MCEKIAFIVGLVFITICPIFGTWLSATGDIDYFKQHWLNGVVPAMMIWFLVIGGSHCACYRLGYYK